MTCSLWSRPRAELPRWSIFSHGLAPPRFVWLRAREPKRRYSDQLLNQFPTSALEPTRSCQRTLDVRAATFLARLLAKLCRASLLPGLRILHGVSGNCGVDFDVG